MRRRLKAACAIFGAMVAAAPAAADSFDMVKLIRNADAGVKDAGGWAADMLSGFADSGIEASHENVCSTIAIISQESGFVANPAVPGLGKLAIPHLRVVGDEVLDLRSRGCGRRLGLRVGGGGGSGVR